MEIWKDVKGYEGIYIVSNCGRIISLKRKGKRKNIVLTPNDNRKGYLCVSLTKDSKKQTKKIHSIVAESFLNHVSQGRKIVINHIDHNRKNNNLKNLEIVTARENANLKHIKSSSKYLGVSYCKSRKKWESRIQLNGKNLFLGYFDNEYKAHLKYLDVLNKNI